tara:strand:- start:484 stop:1332 length:849 start_codon:yes stop_codon:yes gene_type:complete
MSNTIKFAWHDHTGRRHRDSFQSDTKQRSVIEARIHAMYPAKRVTILSIEGNGMDGQQRDLVDGLYGAQNRENGRIQREKVAQWQETQRQNHGQINSGTISGGSNINGEHYTDASDSDHYGGTNTAALWALGAGATVLTAKGLWWGGKTAFKGISWGVSSASGVIKEGMDEAAAEEQAAKNAGPEAYAAYEKKQSRNLRIGTFLGLGTLSAIIPGLGVAIYTLGFGPYWGNKAGDAICKKKGITNKWAKMALIGALMVPVGMPVGMLSFAAVNGVVNTVRAK